MCNFIALYFAANTLVDKAILDMSLVLQFQTVLSTLSIVNPLPNETKDERAYIFMKAN